MRWRLLAIFLGVIVMVLLAQDVPLASHLRQVEKDRLLAGLERDAFILGGSSENQLSGEGDDLPTLQSTVDLYRTRNGAQVVVTDARGIAIVVSDDEARRGDDFATRPEIATALTGVPASGTRSSETLGERIVYVAVPVLSGADIVGTVRITYPADTIDDRANEKVRGLLLVGVISLSAAGIAALFMAGTVVRPLRRLQRATERVARGEFTSRAETDEGPPEVRALATSFNSMTERIATLVERQRSFAGEASHQLRTPLTALRLQLERAGDLVDTQPEVARDRIEAATAETERLQRLIEGLLLLARAESNDVVLVDVDVAAVARERVSIWQPLAAERGITVTIEAPPSAPARSVADAVEQVVDNYIDNALNVSPDDSAIDVVVNRSGGLVEVHVSDRGPGMDADHLARAFDRFWRSPTAEHEGSGLGLAIVHQLASASGGSVAVANRPGGGLTATLRLLH